MKKPNKPGKHGSNDKALFWTVGLTLFTFFVCLAIILAEEVKALT